MKVIADDALICVVSCLLMVYMTAVGLWRNYDWAGAGQGEGCRIGNREGLKRFQFDIPEF